MIIPENVSKRILETNNKDIEVCEAEINRLSSLTIFIENGIEKLLNDKKQIENKISSLQKKIKNLKSFGKSI